MKLFQTTCHEAGVINWVQFLEGPPPNIYSLTAARNRLWVVVPSMLTGRQ